MTALWSALEYYRRFTLVGANPKRAPFGPAGTPFEPQPAGAPFEPPAAPTPEAVADGKGQRLASPS